MPPFTRPLLAGALAATALSAIDTQAAIFLKITGPEIKGESVDAKHKSEIAVNSFSQGFAATIAAGGGGARAGKASCAPVEITKQLDLASGPLINAVMKGTVLQKSVFSFTTNSGDRLTYYVVTLSNSLVSSVVQTVDGDRPGESVEFVPQQIELKYFQQNNDGQLEPGNTTVIDCSNSKF
jgi:type VI secretion system secreted protein Hcp